MPACKYKKEFPKKLIEHMALGKSFDAFGGVADVTRETLYQWVKRYPAFKRAKDIGELKSLDKWESLGLAGMMGKIKGWNAVSWIFIGKCRFRKYGWTDVPDLAETFAKERKADAEALVSKITEIVREQECQRTQSLPVSSPPQSPSGLLGASSETRSTN